MRKQRAADRVAEAEKLQERYAILQPAPLHDVSQTVAWAARAGAMLIDEALHDPDLDEAERRRVVGNLLGKVGLLSNKAQLAGRVEAIEKSLRDIQGPRSSPDPPTKAEVEPPMVIPARGTPLWEAWRGRGALPPDGANTVEAPETSRAYKALLAKEPT